MTPWFSWSRTHNCSTATTPSVLGQDQFLLDLHASAATQHNTEARQTQLKCLVCMLAISVGPYHPCQVLQFFGNTIWTVWLNHAHHTYMPLGLVVSSVYDKCKSVLSYWFIMSSKGWWFNLLIQNSSRLPTCTDVQLGCLVHGWEKMRAPAVILVLCTTIAYCPRIKKQLYHEEVQ